jgi:hypothetical protein
MGSSKALRRQTWRCGDGKVQISDSEVRWWGLVQVFREKLSIQYPASNIANHPQNGFKSGPGSVIICQEYMGQRLGSNGPTARSTAAAEVVDFQ